MKEINLFCFPYAGGSARAIYSKWEDALDSSIDVKPIELSGHGGRISEPHYSSISEAVTDMLNIMRPLIMSKPYAIYGHSMGTLLAYEVALALKREGLPQPKVLFLSGRKPLHLINETKPMHSLSDSEFIDSIMKIGGTPKELFDTIELRNIFLPILRNDYLIVDNNKFRGTIGCVDSDIVFFYSNEDNLVTIPEILEWKKYGNGNFNFYEYNGGHFFINECYKDICKKISELIISKTYVKETENGA